MGAFSDLKDLILRKPDGVLPSIEAFPAISVEQLAGEMALARRGTERGAAGLPPLSASSPDSIELEVVGDIERRVRKASEEYRQNLDIYESRIRQASLTSAERVAISAAGERTLVDFEASIQHDEDELRLRRKTVAETEAEYDEFRSTHGLRRSPRIVRPRARQLRWLVIVLFVLIEAAVNGTFFAKGSESGLVGGVSQALGLSLVNIGVAVAYGLFGTGLLWHRSVALKILGVLLLIAFGCWAVSLNLGIAHFRDLFIANDGVVAPARVIAEFTRGPLALVDMQSVLLACLGLGFAIVAVFDVASLKDRYPGFSAIGSRRQAAHDAYVAGKGRCVTDLQAVRDAAVREMQDVIADLDARARDRQDAIDGRKRLHDSYGAYLDHLLGALDQLVARYREANRAARTDGVVPEYFAARAAHLLVVNRPELSSMIEIDEGAPQAIVADIKAYIVKLNDALRVGLERYQSIDSLAVVRADHAAA